MTHFYGVNKLYTEPFLKIQPICFYFMISFHFLSFILFHYLFTILHLFPFFSILFSISVPPCSQSIARPPSRHSFFVHFLLSDAHFFRFDARLALLLTQRHTDRQSSLTVHLHSGTSHVLSGLFRNGRRSLPLDVAPPPADNQNSY